MKPSNDIRRLIEIMAALRAPKTGCPWDLGQTHKSLAPYALEEAYELVDAIERDDMDDLLDELGDLLLQVVFHARVAEEARAFDFGDVVEAVTSKMVRRHPHVFSDAAKPPAPKSGVDKIWDAMRARRAALDGGDDETEDPDHGLVAAMREAEDKVAFSNETWESIKAAERKEKDRPAPEGLLAGVPGALPGLSRAAKLQSRAATVGFDWGEAKPILAKIREEIDELEEALRGDGAAQKIEDEIGDLLFAVANLARHVDVDPEGAVRVTNRKFERRFGFIEKELLARGSTTEAATLEEMDALWKEAKAAGL